MRTIRTIARWASVLCIASMTACSTTNNSAAFVGAPAPDLSGSKFVKASGEEYWQHTATAQDKEFLASTTPLTARWAVLYVNGLGCPLCATNIEKQLERLKGVQSSAIDLGTGTATLALLHTPGTTPPSPAAIHKAVTDAGFTLVKIVAK